MKISKLNRDRLRAAGTFLLGAAVFVCAVALVLDTYEVGQDFEVFWRGADHVLKGEPLYALNRDGGMVFKYPPWILAVFLPLALFPLPIAKLFWGLSQLFCLGWTCSWLKSNLQVETKSLLLSLMLFWGLWAVHALDGQVILLILAVSLWTWKKDFLQKTDWKSVVLVSALSTKIFTLFPILSSRVSRKTPGLLFKVLGICCLLSFPAYLSQGGSFVPGLFQRWQESATSSGARLDAAQVRGRKNPGMPGMLMRLGKVPAEKTWIDVVCASLLSLLAGIGWASSSRKMKAEESWVGWLALTPVIHPLPWWHMFVLAFPLSALVIESAFRMNNKVFWVLTFFGVGMVAVFTEKTLGNLGIILEFYSIKSWGVILLCSLLWASREKKFLHSR